MELDQVQSRLLEHGQLDYLDILTATDRDPGLKKPSTEAEGFFLVDQTTINWNQFETSLDQTTRYQRRTKAVVQSQQAPQL